MTFRTALTNAAPRSAVAIALAIALGACGGAGDRSSGNPPKAASAAPPSAAQAPTVALPAPAEGAKDSETAKASDQPMKEMSENEEATSMPQPGQANDHSTLAKDTDR